MLHTCTAPNNIGFDFLFRQHCNHRDSNLEPEFHEYPRVQHLSLNPEDESDAICLIQCVAPLFLFFFFLMMQEHSFYFTFQNIQGKKMNGL